MSNAACDISIIVPVYKEEQSIAPFLARVVPIVEKLGTYEILFCLDPSPDRTEEAIREAAKQNPNIALLVFSRRFGQPAAMMAGIRHCNGRNCVLIDVDMQDPPEMIADFYAKISEGYDVVSARRTVREGETLTKRIVAWLGYCLINAIAEIHIPRNVGDFRMMNRRVIDELAKLTETHSYLRGLVPLVGFKQTYIDYQRAERQHGAGHYNRFFGSIAIGLNGIVGFSTFPLKFVLLLGVSIACLSFIAMLYILISKLSGTNYPLGIPTLSISMFFLGGVQLIAIGVLGEYIGRIYDEVRRRPPYIIDKAMNVEH